jgi:tetratricopeptide (TPR) repeat protein
MIKIKVILFFVITLFLSKEVFSFNDLSAKAEKLYEQKKYKEALVVYDSILSQKLFSANLYFNIANCYYKNNQLGLAIYNYELANKINPNDQDIKVNLKIANNKTIDKIESKENYLIGVITNGVVNYYSSNFWTLISIIAFNISLVTFFLFFISKNILLKRLYFFTGLFALFVFFLAMTLGYSSINHKQKINYGIILSEEAKILSEPNVTSEIKFKLHEGAKVSILKHNSQWVNIKLENGNEGWINSSLIGLF